MSALARILLARGVDVSGSDAQASELTGHLAEKGARISIGHRAELVEGAARVVVSDAIPEDNPEWARARSLGIAVLRRSELLAELMVDRRGVAVSGTHGKTTVTAMIGQILTEAGMDPTVVAGGIYSGLGGNARAGAGEWFVAEACEAYESFLDLTPEIAVVTNIEADHLDHHGTEGHLVASFREFLKCLRPNGCAVLCADRPEVMEMAAGLERRVVTYGLAEGAQVRGEEVSVEGLGGRCRLWVEGKQSGELRIQVPGLHNLVNALGAVAAAREAGAPVQAALRALSAFTGADRRFQLLGEHGGVMVVDDYAHHPTEIAATIAAARVAFPGRRLVAVFQPHLYSRTRDFAGAFSDSLGKADAAAIAEIYPARESPINGVTSASIADPLRERWGKDRVWELTKEGVAVEVCARTRPGDVVLVMGAGDIGESARQLTKLLDSKNARE
jgi:UDP-N-acetylmuramate--alanine ligase